MPLVVILLLGIYFWRKGFEAGFGAQTGVEFSSVWVGFFAKVMESTITFVWFILE